MTLRFVLIGHPVAHSVSPAIHRRAYQELDLPHRYELCDTPDEAVFLPGRNVLLLAKALLWCHLHEVPVVAMALLEANPFPDATPAFFRRFADAVNLAVDGTVTVVCPYAGLHKTDVLRRGRGLPLEWTFSCIRPISGRHCGACNKCAERKRGFADAGLPDPTAYAGR